LPTFHGLASPGEAALLKARRQVRDIASISLLLEQGLGGKKTPRE
jgi:hypothetical protein